MWGLECCAQEYGFIFTILETYFLLQCFQQFTLYRLNLSHHLSSNRSLPHREGEGRVSFYIYINKYLRALL